MAAETGLRLSSTSRLPNLFGEHGRPRYNSFVATFVDAVIEGRTPAIDGPADRAAARPAGRAVPARGPRAAERRLIEPPGTPTSVQQVFDTLRPIPRPVRHRATSRRCSTELDVDLFNTLRAAVFPARYPIPLTPRADHRGSLVEVVRAHGGQGQTFVSTTRPGMHPGRTLPPAQDRAVRRARAAEATISLRKMFSHRDRQLRRERRASRASSTCRRMWAHNITNTGGPELTTLFWTHELFDPMPAGHLLRAGGRRPVELAAAGVGR